MPSTARDTEGAGLLLLSMSRVAICSSRLRSLFLLRTQARRIASRQTPELRWMWMTTTLFFFLDRGVREERWWVEVCSLSQITGALIDSFCIPTATFLPKKKRTYHLPQKMHSSDTSNLLHEVWKAFAICSRHTQRTHPNTAKRRATTASLLTSRLSCMRSPCQTFSFYVLLMRLPHDCIYICSDIRLDCSLTSGAETDDQGQLRRRGGVLGVRVQGSGFHAHREGCRQTPRIVIGRVNHLFVTTS